MATRMPARTVAHSDYMRKHLGSKRNAIALLDEALAEGDAGDVAYALRAIVDAQGGIGSLAAATGLNRQGLYRALSHGGNPGLGTALAVIRAVGMRLRAGRAR